MSQLGPWVAEAFSAKFIVLYVFLGSAAWVHYRGVVRHKFTRQLFDHSTFMAPINVFMYAFSAVPNRPILDVKDFEVLTPLRENWQTIRDEALALHEEGAVKASESFDDLGFNSFFRRGWKRYYLKWYADPLASAERDCPKTVELLRSVPGMKAAMFTMLPPGGKLVKHRDPYAGSIRYHLGLACPNVDTCFLEVDGQRYSWRDGEDVIFDETYIHHAENNADSDRLILFCDIERPMKFGGARAVNRAVANTLLAFAATRNETGEKVGILNKIFGFVYPIRMKFKALKKANRKLYYAVKYASWVGIAYLIFV